MGQAGELSAHPQQPQQEDTSCTAIRVDEAKTGVLEGAQSRTCFDFEQDSVAELWVELQSEEFDPFLEVFKIDDEKELVRFDDDSGSG